MQPTELYYEPIRADGVVLLKNDKLGKTKNREKVLRQIAQIIDQIPDAQERSNLIGAMTTLSTKPIINLDRLTHLPLTPIHSSTKKHQLNILTLK
jgi:hypothetical protein